MTIDFNYIFKGISGIESTYEPVESLTSDPTTVYASWLDQSDDRGQWKAKLYEDDTEIASITVEQADAVDHCKVTLAYITGSSADNSSTANELIWNLDDSSGKTYKVELVLDGRLHIVTDHNHMHVTIGDGTNEYVTEINYLDGCGTWSYEWTLD